MQDDEWQSVMDTNLTGAFNMMRAMAPAMTAAGYGRIVNISSINGLRGKFGQANYTAAKAGLIGLTKTAARELGAKGITVNVVAPGMFSSDMMSRVPPGRTCPIGNRDRGAGQCGRYRRCGAVPALGACREDHGKCFEG